MTEFLFEQELREACFEVASNTVSGSISHDIIETISDEYFLCAKTYERRLNKDTANMRLLVNAVWFIAESLAHGEIGRDVRWFDSALDAIIELTIPTRKSTSHGADLRRQASINLDRLNRKQS
jgi:hypothetical protein